MSKLLYKRNFFYRVIAYFFYYWLFLTVLLFMPLCLFGTAFVFLKISGISAPSVYDTTTNTENWTYLIIGLAVSIWAVWYLIHAGKKMFRRMPVVEGFISTKEKREFDEGTCYYITVGKKNMELTEKAYSLVHEQMKVKVWYSEKLNEIQRIEKC